MKMEGTLHCTNTIFSLYKQPSTCTVIIYIKYTCKTISCLSNFTNSLLNCILHTNKQTNNNDLFETDGDTNGCYQIQGFRGNRT